ncbi:MAG: thioredoxin domain-containing protein [Woeseiaceae bacterium]|nr:thioredoxin domain-containing protein [Woeseiaceae bacterium]
MPNRLARETSPYLLQHADNPVDWYPWGEEAFQVARDRDLPVLLSVGYSACHWCHVMAHESFEDEATAAVMNELFVNVKIDREERPDIDKIYQTAQQLLTQRGGGWPLTMFINPEDQRPFFGGTYFPNEARHGLPAFGDLLKSVSDYYQKQRDKVRGQGEQLQRVFAQLEPPPAEGTQTLDEAPLSRVRKQLEQTFDRDYGGFGSAPKFPHPTTIERLLRHWRSTASGAEPDIDALFMATLTLTRMAEGGLFDHLGGGFCRYSVDRYWQIPHFEKMLYDNGPMLALYAQAYLATGDGMFEDVAAATADWMLSDMQSPEGGFYATRDADSEGEEGRYYVWSPDQVRDLLPAADFELFARHFGLDRAANFEGKWHLAVNESLSDIAKDLQRDEAELKASVGRSKSVLLAERSRRVPPGRDEKQLTSWNALAIKGLAIAGRSLDREDLVDAAVAATDFIYNKLFREGHLLANYKDGKAKLGAYLDDYAFLLDALLELLQSRFSPIHLEFAIRVAELLRDDFEDESGGGFYFTAEGHEKLMHRPKPLADEAVPSGNGVAAVALQRLGFLLGETSYLEAAERTLRAAWNAIYEYPHGHVSLLTALEEYLDHPEIIIIRGDESETWRDAAAKLYSPSRLVFAIPVDAASLPGALAERKPLDGQTVAYRCKGTHCDLPVSDWRSFARFLKD